MCHVIIFSLFMTLLTGNFKTEQLKNSRVKVAYNEKQKLIEQQLKTKNIQLSQIEIYLQAFKYEEILEVWAKNKNDKTFQLLLEYKICQSSGTLGPKRKEGDLQVPEGFYSINHFNPLSNFYLSLGINYPNKSDRVFADKAHPGGSIYIHGSCVTIGCIPLTDDKIKEVYILAVEAKNNSQNIPVTIYPFKPTKENINKFQNQAIYNASTKNLWTDLTKAYNLFNEKHTLPTINFLANGQHDIH